MIIYKISNKINGKAYIGQTIQSVQDRWKTHRAKNSQCKYLKRAIEKYGIENFEITELAKAENLEQLNELEAKFIKELNTLAPNGYNLMTGGSQPRHTEETKKLMSDLKKGYVPWNKGLIGVQEAWNKGKTYKMPEGKGCRGHNEEAKEKLRKANLGKVQSEETVFKRFANRKTCTFKVTLPDGSIELFDNSIPLLQKFGIKKGSFWGRLYANKGVWKFNDILIEQVTYV